MRPLVVVGLLEAIEGLLLRPNRRPRRHRGLGLQRLVEALVPAILVGPSRLDEHRRHANPHEPDPEPRQPAKAVGAEGRPAVAQHVLRQPEGPECLFQPAPYVVGLRLHHRLPWSRADTNAGNDGTSEPEKQSVSQALRGRASGHKGQPESPYHDSFSGSQSPGASVAPRIALSNETATNPSTAAYSSSNLP